MISASDTFRALCRGCKDHNVGLLLKFFLTHAQVALVSPFLTGYIVQAGAYQYQHCDHLENFSLPAFDDGFPGSVAPRDYWFARATSASMENYNRTGYLHCPPRQGESCVPIVIPSDCVSPLLLSSGPVPCLPANVWP